MKSLTLAPWGTESEYPPLKIATPDKKGFSPFSIAVFRGHLQLARMIVDIAQAQYQPPEKVRKRFDLRPFNGDDGDETDSDNEITLYSELVDENFTIENVACVAKTVKSEISPLAMLSQRFLVWRLTGERFYQVERDVRLRQTEDLSSTSYGTREPWVSLHFGTSLDY